MTDLLLFRVICIGVSVWFAVQGIRNESLSQLCISMISGAALILSCLI